MVVLDFGDHSGPYEIQTDVGRDGHDCLFIAISYSCHNFHVLTDFSLELMRCLFSIEQCTVRRSTPTNYEKFLTARGKIL